MLQKSHVLVPRLEVSSPSTKLWAHGPKAALD